MKKILLYGFCTIMLLVGACSKDKIPGLYVIDIRQGNDVTQEMINKLKPGMTKQKVAYVMGTPLVIDTFHPNRWDYIYSFRPGEGDHIQRRITLYFEKDKLKYIEGDIRTVARQDLPKINSRERNVVVPLTEKKPSLLQKLLAIIGLK